MGLLKNELLQSSRGIATASNLFPNYMVDTSTNFKSSENLRIIYSPQHGPSFSFTLVTHEAYFMEARLGDLLRYMCTFDSRAMPLLTLVRYWAKINQVFLGEGQEASQSKLITPGSATLDWLVISWMVQRGLVPSPERILSRNHQHVYIQLTEVFVVDVGFSTDSELAEEWTKQRSNYPKVEDNFILSILLLAQGFFQDFAKMKTENWLLNTRIGKLKPTKKNINCDPLNNSQTTRLSVTSPFIATSRLRVKDFSDETFSSICDIMGDVMQQLSSEYNQYVQFQAKPGFDLATSLQSSIKFTEKINTISSQAAARNAQASKLTMEMREDDDCKRWLTFPSRTFGSLLQCQFSSIRLIMETS